jgi:light-regulated signal transduction histidine kinase (bacteriophytochrome)
MMRKFIEEFKHKYFSLLGDYLNEPTESLRQEAYQLARTAVSDEMSIIDLMQIHHDALAIILSLTDPLIYADKYNIANEFLREVLAPFEIIFRGYRDANNKLMELNNKLEAKTNELIITNKELEAFSYSVSHDLKAPLRSMIGFSNILLENYLQVLDEAGQDLLKRIYNAGQKMEQLINGLLSLSRLSRQEILFRDFDLIEIARNVIEELHQLDPDRKVVFTMPNTMTVKGDANLLSIVLQNLLSNAWKFTSKQRSPQIELGVLEQNQEVIYFVRDNGVGFDMAYISKLFGVFQRLHSIHEFEGNGIGLATVQRIIERHGGRIWADGKVNEGAAFYFTLMQQ